MIPAPSAPPTALAAGCRRAVHLAAWSLGWAMLPAHAEIPAGDEGFRSTVRPFFEEHCFHCHGPEKSKGKLTLHQLTGVGGDDKDMKIWEDIMTMLEDGDMPPDDEPQPDARQREAITRWIDQGIHQAASNKGAAGHGPVARRLTNFEYQNTMRDLLGIDLDLADNLPKDPVKPYEFNNTAELMRLGPEQIEGYLQNARKAMASVIVEGERPEVVTVRNQWSSELAGKSKMPPSHLGVFGNSRGSISHGLTLSKFPQRGPFKLRFRASALLTRGATEVPIYWIMGDSIQVNSSTCNVKPVGTTVLSSTEPQEYELGGLIENFPVQTGRRQKQKSLPDAITITPLNLFDDGTIRDDRSFFKETNASYPRPVVEWAEFVGPVYDSWPPETHTRILFDSPLRESDPTAYVRQVLDRFMSRAYRRPATAGEIERMVGIYNLVKPEMGSMEAAMRETLAMVLISPQFLMHTEVDGGPASREYALASRLSYFLWGTMPDEHLIELAASGELGQARVLRQQIERMIQDARFGDFARNFTMQWMSIDKMRTVPINNDLFPRFLYKVTHGERKDTEQPYIPTIRDHMITETVGYVEQMIKANAGVRNLVDSDVAYLNQPLAAHYGMEGVKTHRHQLVTLKPGHKLGGLPSHGSVLIGNGTGTAPHPIYRAVWLREAILGEEVAPPPAEVPALSDTAGESAEKALSIKDLLARHRTETSCNDCHARLDPWGIPFEHYNAIGLYQPKVPKQGVRVEYFDAKKHGDLKGYFQYLESINTETLDASSRLPNGPEVRNMEELKTYIIGHRLHDVADNVTRRLLAYGLGRPLDFRDRPQVESLLAQSKGNDYKLRDLLVSICMSETFLQP